MECKKTAFKESLLSVPCDRHHVQTGATPGQTVTSLCLMLMCHKMRSVISHKHHSRKTFYKSIPVPKLKIRLVLLQ